MFCRAWDLVRQHVSGGPPPAAIDQALFLFPPKSPIIREPSGRFRMQPWHAEAQAHPDHPCEKSPPDDSEPPIGLRRVEPLGVNTSRLRPFCRGAGIRRPDLCTPADCVALCESRRTTLAADLHRGCFAGMLRCPALPSRAQAEVP